MTIQINQLSRAPKLLDAVSTAPTTGAGLGSFYAKDIGAGQIEGFYVDHAGAEVQITENGQLKLPSVLGEQNTASNLAGGEGIFAQKSGVDLEFKSLIAGTNVTIDSAASTLTINATSIGEANTASNVGGGNEIFKQKALEDLQFRTLVAGPNVTIVSDADTLTISATSGGGSSLTVRDEGSVIDSAVSELNFTGTGVSASQTSPGVIEVAISTGVGGSDELLKVSANDSTAGYLLDKLTPGTNITLVEENNGSNETLRIDAAGEANPDVVPQSEAEAGIATTERIWTAQRVKQAIDALAPSGGGGSIAIEDEGSEIVAAASRINFTGTGVTATDAGSGEVTVSITSGTGAVDSVNSQTGTVVLDADDIDDSSTTNKFTTVADISKLAGIEAGAEVNEAQVSSGEKTAGTETALRSFSPSDVKDMIDTHASGGGGSSLFQEFSFELSSGGSISARTITGLPAGWKIGDGTGAAVTGSPAMDAISAELSSGSSDLILQHGLNANMIEFICVSLDPSGPPFGLGNNVIDFTTGGSNQTFRTESGELQSHIKAFQTDLGSNACKIYIRFL